MLIVKSIIQISHARLIQNTLHEAFAQSKPSLDNSQSWSSVDHLQNCQCQNHPSRIMLWPKTDFKQPRRPARPDSPRGFTVGRSEWTESSVCSSVRETCHDEDANLSRNKPDLAGLPTPTASVVRAPSTVSQRSHSTHLVSNSQRLDQESYRSGRSWSGSHKKRNHCCAFGEPSDEEESQNSSESPSWADDQSSSTTHTLSPELDTPETYSRTLPKLDPGHPFASQDITEKLTDIFLAEFSSTRRTSTASTPHASGRKRAKRSSSQPQRTTGKLLSGDRCKADTRFFACPYYLHNRQKHITCSTRHCLLTIHDVREHLCLEHKRPPFCPVCYEVFSTYTARDEHLRRQDCPLRSPVAIEGLTVAQLEELEEMGQDEQDEDERDEAASEHCETAENVLRSSQWYDVWSVVFPATPTDTVLPFLTAERESRVYEMRRFWNVHGQRIISDVLEERGMKGYSIENEERNLEALFCFVADCAVDRMMASGSASVSLR